MLNTIIVVSERAAGVVGWVNKLALDLARELLFKRLERKQIVAKDEFVIEQIAVGDAMRRVIGLFRVLQQNARLQFGPVLLPNPCQL